MTGVELERVWSLTERIRYCMLTANVVFVRRDQGERDVPTYETETADDS
jgi:hypothetical protein